jgi:hypothetical protein
VFQERQRICWLGNNSLLKKKLGVSRQEGSGFDRKITLICILKKEARVVNRIDVAQYMGKKQVLVNTVASIRVPYRKWKFLVK